MKYEELIGLSVDRLFNLQKLEIKNIEHYVIRDDLYTKNDILQCIENLVVINSQIKSKLKKYEKTKK